MRLISVGDSPRCSASLRQVVTTCPTSVIDMLFNHPLTNIGLEKFLKDWEKVHGPKA